MQVRELRIPAFLDIWRPISVLATPTTTHTFTHAVPETAVSLEETREDSDLKEYITSTFESFHNQLIRKNWEKHIESAEEPLWMMLLGDGITHLDFDTQYTQTSYLVYFDVYAQLPREQFVCSAAVGHSFLRTRFQYTFATDSVAGGNEKVHSYEMNNGIQAACKLFQLMMLKKSTEEKEIALTRNLTRNLYFAVRMRKRLNRDVIKRILYFTGQSDSKFDRRSCELEAIKWMSYEWHHKIPQEYTWVNFQHRMQTFAVRGYASYSDYVEPLNLQRYEEASGGNWQLGFMSDWKLEDLRKKREEIRKQKQQEERSEQERS